MEDVKPLLVFAAVLEQGSMNAAAQALQMTPSAVSQHIARLESVRGVKLLNRSTRRLTPTDAGEALAEHCRRLRQTLREVQVALENLKEAAAGDLHLAVPSTLLHAPPLQRALAMLQCDYPEVHPWLHSSDELLDLHQGGVDIAIRGGEHALDAPDLIARPLVSWPWRICATPEYLARHEAISRPEQLMMHPWIFWQPLRLPMQREEKHFLLECERGTRCNTLAAAHTLVLAGLGLGVQLSGEIEAALAQGRLQVVLPEWQLPVVSLYAVTPYRVQSAKTAVMLRLLQQAFREG